MNIVFLDEFGHIGPYISRADTKFCQSPVFGLAGFIMPCEHVRSFSTWFLQNKESLLQRDIKNLNVYAATWEKKGTKLITTKNIHKYANLRQTLFRLINQISKC